MMDYKSRIQISYITLYVFVYNQNYCSTSIWTEKRHADIQYESEKITKYLKYKIHKVSLYCKLGFQEGLSSMELVS